MIVASRVNRVGALPSVNKASVDCLRHSKPGESDDHACKSKIPHGVHANIYLIFLLPEFVRSVDQSYISSEDTRGTRSRGSLKHDA